MSRREFGDLSFMMQKLDNTGTIVEVDRAATEFWRAHGQIGDFEEFLTRRIVDLRLGEKEIQFGRASDQITIHRDEGAFVAQFHVDVRDEANRPATVLCYGHLPRALQDGTDRRGERLLRDFLEHRGIPWTDRIRSRYAAVCRELSKSPGLLTGLLGRLFQPPSEPPRPVPVVRLEPRRAQAPPPAAEAPAPVTEVVPETQALPDPETSPDAGSVIDASTLPEAEPHPEAEPPLPETEELPEDPLPEEPETDPRPNESATGGTEDA
jgi:hypothetical protein